MGGGRGKERQGGGELRQQAGTVKIEERSGIDTYTHTHTHTHTHTECEVIPVCSDHTYMLKGSRAPAHTISPLLSTARQVN